MQHLAAYRWHSPAHTDHNSYKHHIRIHKLKLIYSRPQSDLYNKAMKIPGGINGRGHFSLLPFDA